MGVRAAAWREMGVMITGTGKMENGSFWESHWVISTTDMNNVHLSTNLGLALWVAFNYCIKSNCYHLCLFPVTPGMKTSLAFDIFSGAAPVAPQFPPGPSHSSSH